MFYTCLKLIFTLASDDMLYSTSGFLKMIENSWAELKELLHRIPEAIEALKVCSIKNPLSLKLPTFLRANIG